MYSSALSSAVPDKARRCMSTSSMLGCRPSWRLNFGGNAVQITESIFRPTAHLPRLGISLGGPCFLNQLPMFFIVVPSRCLSRSFASSRLSLSIRVHSDRTGRASDEMTNVIRSSLDCRANSSGISGPSSNQHRRIGKSRGSQMREPQPKHAILRLIATMLVQQTGRTRRVWREFPQSRE